MERIPIELGSGNVFTDLGLPNPGELLRKSEQILALRRHLRRYRLSTNRAMRLLGATAVEVEAVRHQRFSRLSAERIGEMFVRLPGTTEPLTPTPEL